MQKNKYKVRTIVCAGCHQTVTGRFRPNQRFCSAQCSSTSAKPARRTGQQVACELCGALVYIAASRVGKTQHNFCSLEHQITWQGRNKDSYTCKVCGRAFRWSPSRKSYNVTYCSLGCRDADPDRRAQLIEMNAAQQRGHQTAIERIGYALLDDMGLAYLPQHVIGGKFCVDAFLPEQGLVVQFNGDYWHGHPQKFPEPDARQRRRMRLDASQDAYMRACGYRVLRLWESDLHQHLDLTRQLISEHI